MYPSPTAQLKRSFPNRRLNTSVLSKVTRSEIVGCSIRELRGLAQLRGTAMGLDDIIAHADSFAAELGIGIVSEQAKRDERSG
jgi:hypothetical protein